MSSYQGCWDRIQRAYVHLHAFAAESKCFFQDHPLAFTFDIKHEGGNIGRGVAKGAFCEPVKNDLALKPGEFFYQLRAALDGAFWQAAIIVSRPNPLTKVNRVEFPICLLDDGKYESSSINTLPFPQDFRNWVESIEPYNFSKTNSLYYAGLNRALAIIHKCARIDRHRHLHVVAALPASASGKFLCYPPLSITYMDPLPQTNLLLSECKFLSFGIAGWDGISESEIEMSGDIQIDISIEEIPTVPTGDLGQELERLLQAAAFVIQNLESTFS